MDILQHLIKKIKRKMSGKKREKKLTSLLFLSGLDRKAKNKLPGEKKGRKFYLPQILNYVSLLPFLAVVVFFPRLIHPSDIQPEKVIDRIGLVADIHAASQDKRTSDNPDNVVSPALYKKLFPEVLEKMEGDKVDLVISLGDQTNNSSPKHARELKRMAEEEEMPMFWVRGNHDNESDKIMEVLGASANYYFVDRGDWRIIVLDSSEQPGEVFYQGGMSQSQMEWLREALDVKKDILIAMHHPIFDKETIQTVYPIYQDFENMISGNKWVRYVVSGHWHTPYWEKEYNGVEYIGVPALLLRGSEGFYKVLKLPSYIYPDYNGPE